MPAKFFFKFILGLFVCLYKVAENLPPFAGDIGLTVCYRDHVGFIRFDEKKQELLVWSALYKCSVINICAGNKYL